MILVASDALAVHFDTFISYHCFILNFKRIGRVVLRILSRLTDLHWTRQWACSVEKPVIFLVHGQCSSKHCGYCHSIFAQKNGTSALPWPVFTRFKSSRLFPVFEAEEAVQRNHFVNIGTVQETRKFWKLTSHVLWENWRTA